MAKSQWILCFILTAFSLYSCGSAKFRKNTDKNKYQQAGIINLHSKGVASSRFENNDLFSEENENYIEARQVQEITSYALDFQGTRYKYGGTTSKGMDCSGLVYTTFLHENISLPRTSRAMSLQGELLPLEKVEAGDLLFFETSKKKVVSHVGLVIETKPGEIFFIHSTTSRGVIISSLNENYWQQHFVMARRVI